MEPAFCYREMTDDELFADLTALKAGHYRGWRLVNEVTYETGYRDGGSLTVYSWNRIWLRNHTGHELVVTLRRLPGQNVWRRVSIPGDD